MRNRRVKKFMGILLGCVLAVLTFFIVMDGAFLKTEYDVESDFYGEEKEFMTELQFQIVKAGILAGSSHNMQPWKIEVVNGNEFLLYADKQKELKFIDGDNRQMLLSQGTFISAARKKADDMGVRMNIEYYEIDLESEKPLIARFLTEDGNVPKVDGVSAGTAVAGASNEKISAWKFEEILIEDYSDYGFAFIDNENLNDLNELKSLLRKGTVIESENQMAMEELLSVFRFSKWDKNMYRYGLSLNTMNPAIKPFAEVIVGKASKWDSFGKASIKAFDKRLEVEESYLVVFIENPRYYDYIKAGELMGDISRAASGYNIKPAFQLLENIDGMEAEYNKLLTEINADGEILFILGFSKEKSKYHESVRHKVKDIIF